jgi:hypothetical protein
MKVFARPKLSLVSPILFVITNKNLFIYKQQKTKSFDFYPLQKIKIPQTAKLGGNLAVTTTNFSIIHSFSVSLQTEIKTIE